MAIDTKEYVNKITTGLKSDDKYEVFYYVFTYRKKKYRGLIDYSDKNWNKRERVKEATFKLMEIKKAKEQGMGDAHVLFDKYFYSFYEKKKDTSWTKALVSHYRRYVSPTIGGMKIKDILSDDIQDALMAQEALALEPRTIKQTLEGLAPVFKNALVNRLIVFNPIEGVSVKRPNTKKVVSNASEELTIIYDGIVEEFKEEPFYKAFYLFALQGRRKGEIMKLEVADVSFSKSYYILRDVKNTEHQKMHLDKELASLLLGFMDKNKKYVFMSPKTDSHIVNVEKTTDRLRKRIGKRFTLHYMRNVIVGAMAESGETAVSMSSTLGHKDLNTLAKYLTLPYEAGSRKASEVIDSLVKRG